MTTSPTAWEVWGQPGPDDQGGEPDPRDVWGEPEPAGDGYPDAPDPELFFGKGGLLAATLTQAVKAQVRHGIGVDGMLWVYGDGHWQPDTNRRIDGAIAALLGDRYRPGHRAAVLELLACDPDAPRLDCEPTPDLLNVANGLLRWSDRKLMPHTPRCLSTVQLPVPYLPGATASTFAKWVAEVLPADCLEPAEGGPGFLWELIGYTVMSGNPLHLAVLLFGSGRNGKGTFLRVLGGLLGKRNVSSVTLHDLIGNRFRAANLFGKIANIAGDLDAKWLESTALFKAMTGGDLIQAERKYGAAWDFTPWAVPVFSANKAFGSPDSSEGYFARWVVIPFPNGFAGREDRTLDARLAKDLPGILAKAVEAIPVTMARGRLPEPASVRQAKRLFVAAANPVRAWADECCTIDGETFTLRAELRASFKAWVDDNDARPLSAQEFYANLDTFGRVRPAVIAGNRGYRGIALESAQ